MEMQYNIKRELKKIPTNHTADNSLQYCFMEMFRILKNLATMRLREQID